MKLYYGSTGYAVYDALKRGINPPTQEEGYSDQAMVQLTSVYAPTFAMRAAVTAASESREGEHLKWGVAEVDVDLLNKSLLRPDVDFLEQASRMFSVGPPLDASVPLRIEWYRAHIDEFAQYWKRSVAQIGSCNYSGTVPAYAITRVAIYTPDSNTLIESVACDPQINTLDHTPMIATKYQALTRWFMGDPMSACIIDPTILFNLAAVDRSNTGEVNRETSRFIRRQEHITEQLANRRGLRVINHSDI